MKGDAMFDYTGWFRAVLKQDRAELRGFFAEDAEIRWHCTNEQFSLEEYFVANCDYPGDWEGEVERVHETGEELILVTRVYPPDRSASFHCVSFLRCREGKIAALDEYWADDGAAPDWRRALKLGKPIREKGKLDSYHLLSS